MRIEISLEDRRTTGRFRAVITEKGCTVFGGTFIPYTRSRGNSLVVEDRRIIELRQGRKAVFYPSADIKITKLVYHS